MQNINSLVIGNTSQLSYYFPEEYEKISSRINLPLSIKSDFYERVFLCFAEQRTFLKDSSELFFNTNVQSTIELIKFFSPKCKKLIVYGTAELWNNCEGPIDINMPFKYNSTDYILSKERMTISLNTARFYDTFKNVIILHPVNFNSTYRKEGFLFSKIFDSIINKKPIAIGDTYFYRDLVHPKYVVERSLLAEKDEIVGSARLIFVNDFIRDLYKGMDLDYDDYVTENFDYNLSNVRKIYYLKNKHCLYSYKNLLNDTLIDIKNARL